MTNSQILDAINQNIKQNGKEEITGVILNSVLRMLLDFVNQGFITFSDIIQLLADSKAINVVGSIGTTTDTASLPSGVYHAQTSGTYTNASGIVVKEGYYTLLRKKDDGSWVLESEVKMPMQDLTKIETELESTKTKVNDFIRDFAVTTDTEFDANSKNPIANSAVTPLSEILDGFLTNDPNELVEITIGKDLAIFGGKFLKANDEIENNSSYPFVGLIYKLDVSNSNELNISGLVAAGNSPKIILGGYKKDGSYSILVRPEDSNLSDLKTFEITDYNTISIQVFSDAFPAIQIKKYGEGTSFKNIDAKNYVDERFIVLDSFLNPTEEIIEEIDMPQPNEVSGAGINDDWQQYAADGLFNGSIPISEFNGFEKIKLTGLTTGLGGIMYLAGYNNTTNIYDKLLVSRNVKGDFIIDINDKYEAYLYSRTAATKFYKIKTEGLQIEKDSVKNYIDNNVGTGSLISLKEKAKIAYPENLVEIDFITEDSLPTAKGTLAKGILNWTDNASTAFKKYATLEVQGSSSAAYPKKNWTFALFNDADYSDDFKLRIGNWAYHSEFVFKSNWIDATHARNILSNKIWEDIVQQRKYYPKRENEINYTANNATLLGRFDSGALCHVDGFPAILKVNGGFYGIGMFNLGKKRENYDLKSSNQNHIQLVAKTHANFYSYIPDQWEVGNPKTPDANFQTKINAWFASNALNGQAFKDAFETNHVLKNAIDFYLLAEFIKSPDMYTKNLILTSWDGIKFYFLPYDMDTTFGLQWDGLSYTGHTSSIREASFWSKFYTAYSVEINARYKDLRESGIFTLNNVYKHADLINKTFGIDSFEKEFETWTVPSNSTILTSYPQIYQWVKDRIVWLDSQYL